MRNLVRSKMSEQKEETKLKGVLASTLFEAGVDFVLLNDVMETYKDM